MCKTLLRYVMYVLRFKTVQYVVNVRRSICNRRFVCFLVKFQKIEGLLSNFTMSYTWVYVLSSETRDGKKWYYVGKTHRLGQRLREHANQRGALATTEFEYSTIEALYKITPGHFNRIEEEDDLTLQLMCAVDNPYRVRGGRWTTHGIVGEYSQSRKAQLEFEVKQLVSSGCVRLCKCKLPIERVWSDKHQIEYATCPRKNVRWYSQIAHLEQYEFNVDACDLFKPLESIKPHTPSFCEECKCLTGTSVFARCFSCEHKKLPGCLITSI